MVLHSIKSVTRVFVSIYWLFTWKWKPKIIDEGRERGGRMLSHGGWDEKEEKKGDKFHITIFIICLNLYIDLNKCDVKITNLQFLTLTKGTN